MFRPSLPSLRTFAPAQRAWGDGLLEQSLSDMWCVRAATDVDADELLFYYPALGGGPPLAAMAAPLQQARAILTARIGQGLAQSSSVWRRAVSLEEVIALAADEAGAGPVAESCTAYAAAVRAPLHPRRLAPLIRDLSVLACLSRAGAPHDPAGRSVFSIADVTVVSLHTGINGAYVAPRYAYAHEFFSAASWIGILAGGRSALLPPVIAQYLLETLTCEPALASAETRLLRDHAAAAMPLWQLRRALRRTLARGRPHLVRATHSLLSPRFCPWNTDLHARMAEGLARIGVT